MMLQVNRAGKMGLAWAATTLVLVAGGMLGGCKTCPTASGSVSEAPAVTPVVALASSREPVNTICPIGGHEITEAGGVHMFEGRVVGFCCEGCYDSWESLSRAERAAKVAAVTPTR